MSLYASSGTGLWWTVLSSLAGHAILSVNFRKDARRLGGAAVGQPDVMDPPTPSSSQPPLWDDTSTRTISSSGGGSDPTTHPVTNSSFGKTNKKSATNTEMVVSLLLELGVVLVTSWIASFLIGRILKSINAVNGNGLSEEDVQASTAAERRLVQLLKESDPNRPVPPLTSYERQIAQDVIDPRDIKVHFSDIGGLDAKKQEIWELVVMPLKRPDLFASSPLLTAPGGILLYGPPGTGKTMLAKAIAKEADATFLAVKLSKIMSKWFGESNKLIDAIFSLAHKLAPSIIFIDEIDTFLNPRDGSENSAGNAIKAEFLTLWDGITTSSNGATTTVDDDGTGATTQFRPVMVLGATNRPNHVDDAILRRLPRSFRIELPDEAGRLQIVQLTLGDHPLSPEARAFLPQLAKITRGYSGSDLKEMIHCAAMEAVREVMREESRKAVTTRQPQVSGKKVKSSSSTTTASTKTTTKTKSQPSSTVRPMSVDDLKVAMTKVKRTGQDASEYERTRFEREHRNDQRTGNGNVDMVQLLAAFNQMMQQSQRQLASSSSSSDDNNTPDDDIPELH